MITELSPRAWSILRQALVPGVSFPEQGPDEDLSALVSAGYLDVVDPIACSLHLTVAGFAAIQRRDADQLDEIRHLGT